MANDLGMRGDAHGSSGTVDDFDFSEAVFFEAGAKGVRVFL